MAWGYVTHNEVDDLSAVIDRAGAMTWSRMQARVIARSEGRRRD